MFIDIKIYIPYYFRACETTKYKNYYINGNFTPSYLAQANFKERDSKIRSILRKC